MPNNHLPHTLENYAPTVAPTEPTQNPHTLSTHHHPDGHRHIYLNSALHKLPLESCPTDTHPHHRLSPALRSHLPQHRTKHHSYLPLPTPANIPLSTRSPGKLNQLHRNIRRYLTCSIRRLRLHLCTKTTAMGNRPYHRALTRMSLRMETPIPQQPHTKHHDMYWV